MPKGAGLHIHQDSSATYDYLIQNGTYLPNCYIYMGLNNPDQEYGSYYFYPQQPSDSNWVLLSTLRTQTPDVPSFDQQLLTNLTLEGRDLGDYVTLWRTFDGIFGRVSGLVTYVPITIGYMLHLFDQMIADNVQHVELRKCFGDFYDLEGNTYNDTWFVETMESLVQQTRSKYNMPQFQVKIIGCNGRHSNTSVVMDMLEYSLELRNQFPSIFVGYDLVGPEDEGYPLLYFIDQFARINQMSNSRKYPLDFYFHAGETLLYNNTNLYDAVLLKSKRIGHGFQLPKHPVLMDMVIQQNIGVEVCPISNQLLEYVSNFRGHPGFDMVNKGLPITISPDDPAIFGYGGLSYDFYEATFGWGLDLAQLKQLALNSLEHSAYFDEEEKSTAYK
eukprot:gene3890-4856_t